MLEVDSKHWRDFDLHKIFPVIQRGKRLIKANQMPGTTPYISSSAVNNGVDAFIGNKHGVRRFDRCLTLANSGSVGTSFYHPYEFVASDHVTVLKNPELNEYSYRFLIPILNRLSEKYGFNREISDTRIRRERILLPINALGDPDWDYMEAFVKMEDKGVGKRALRHISEQLNNLPLPISELELGATQWSIKVLDDLFDFTIGKNLDGNKIDKDTGSTPYITRAATNNGVVGFTSGHESEYLWSKTPVITIGNETAKPFVQAFPFYTGTKVNILTPKKPMSIAVLLFVAKCIEANQERYSYSYTANSTRLKSQRIMLPVLDGELDYDFMAQMTNQFRYQALLAAAGHFQKKLANLKFPTGVVEPYDTLETIVAK